MLSNAAVIRCGIRSGPCDPDHMSVADLVADADDKLFNHILYSKRHVLHRQITMPAPHHSVFYRPDALPAQPTASKH